MRDLFLAFLSCIPLPFPCPPSSTPSSSSRCLSTTLKEEPATSQPLLSLTKWAKGKSYLLSSSLNFVRSCHSSERGNKINSPYLSTVKTRRLLTQWNNLKVPYCPENKNAIGSLRRSFHEMTSDAFLTNAPIFWARCSAYLLTNLSEIRFAFHNASSAVLSPVIGAGHETIRAREQQHGNQLLSIR